MSSRELGHSLATALDSALNTAAWLALLLALPALTAACDGACVETFERDPRYAALKSFDPPVFHAMQARATAVKERGAACRAKLDEELRAPLDTSLKRAFHEAPDQAVVDFIRAEWRRAKALASVDPGSCVQILEKSPSVNARLGWDELPKSERQASERAEARLLDAARVAGVRPSPSANAITSEEASAFGRRQRQRHRPEAKFAFAPSATPRERCQGDLEVYRVLLTTPDPALGRLLRSLKEEVGAELPLTPLRADDVPPMQIDPP